MALVDPKLLEALNTVPSIKPQDPVIAKMTELDQQMKAALDSPGDVAHKVQTYNQILQRFLLQQENHEQTPIQVQIKPPPLSREKSDPVEADVMASLPKSFHSKAEYLLTRLRNDPNVDWNARGEVSLDHRLIPGSNLADLINDIFRDKKSVFDPVGSLEFANHLHAMNVPREFIGNKARMRSTNKRKRQDTDSPSLNETSDIASKGYLVVCCQPSSYADGSWLSCI